MWQRERVSQYFDQLGKSGVKRMSNLTMGSEAQLTNYADIPASNLIDRVKEEIITALIRANSVITDVVCWSTGGPGVSVIQRSLSN